MESVSCCALALVVIFGIIRSGGEMKNFNLRALRVIEKLCFVWEDSDKSIKTATGILDDIYMFSHLTGDCANKHKDWRKRFFKIEKELEDK